MLVRPGCFAVPGRRGNNPILSLQNLLHYSDPALSQISLHTNGLIKEILPVKGVHKFEQPDDTLAMDFRPAALDGLGGYGFPQNDRWMMYEADPAPFQAHRTIGVVFSLEGSLSNDMIFGYAKFNAFNTSWRVQTNSNSGGLVNFGRDLNGSFPTLIPNATPGRYILIIRQNSIDEHEFFVNSFSNPIVIDPRDDYYSSNRVRLMLGRIGTTRSETAATIGGIFDCLQSVKDSENERVMKYWSARFKILLS